MQMGRLVVGGIAASGMLALFACGGVASTSSSAQPDGGPAAQPGTAASETAEAVTRVCTALTAAPTCEPALDVASADDVAAILGALAEPTFSSTTSDSGAALQPTPDLHATTAIVLDIAGLRGPGTHCPDAGDAGNPSAGCRETWAFSGEKNAPWNYPVTGGTPARPLPSGVTCSDAACSKIAIAAGSVVRLQKVFEPVFFGPRFAHFVRVTRACATPCDGDELRCTTSTTCIQKKAFCTLCEGKKNDVCACRDGCDVTADGARCQYVSSDDTGAVGSCSAGACH